MNEFTIKLNHFSHLTAPGARFLLDERNMNSIIYILKRITINAHGKKVSQSRFRFQIFGHDDDGKMMHDKTLKIFLTPLN